VLFLVTTAEARGLPGFRGSISWENAMASSNNKSEGFRLPIMQGLLPIKGAQVPLEIVAGLTLAALMNTAQPPLRWFCIDASAVPDVDYSAAETLRSLFTALDERGIRLVVADALYLDPDDHYELRQLLGEDALYGTLDEVVQAYQQEAG